VRIQLFRKRPKHFSKGGWDLFKIGPLSMFARCHSNGELIRATMIAGWHWENSITWSWVLSYYWPTKKYWFGRFVFNKQAPMWRDNDQG